MHTLEYYGYYSTRLASTIVCICLFVNRPPGSHPLNPDAPGFSGYVVHLGQVGGMPRRIPNKKLTKSYTRYPVVVLGGPVRRSL